MSRNVRVVRRWGRYLAYNNRRWLWIPAFAGRTKEGAAFLRGSAITKPLNMLAAVDVDFGAVHVGAGLRAQHVDDLRDLVGRAEPVHRDLLLDDLFGAGRKDRGVDLAGGDRIDAHADPAEIGRHLARQRGERRLRGRIGRARERMHP